MADKHLISVRLGDLLSILLVEEPRASVMKGLNNTNDLPDGGMYKKGHLKPPWIEQTQKR